MNRLKFNKYLVAIGVQTLTAVEYEKMLGAADACYKKPNTWTYYDRPWLIHHMSIGSIYMYISEHPVDGIHAVLALPNADGNDEAPVEIAGCASLNEAKEALIGSLATAVKGDPRYAEAFVRVVEAKACHDDD